MRDDSGRIVYAGNGNYSLAVQTYTTDRCTGTCRIHADSDRHSTAWRLRVEFWRQHGAGKPPTGEA